MTDAPPAPPWSLAPDPVCRALDVDPAAGLASGEAARRLAATGPNALVEEPSASRLEILGRQFRSPMVYLLLAAVVLSAILGDAFDAATIGAILILNTLIGYGQEAKAERAVADLKQLTAPRARVLRGGTVVEIPAAGVVPGDILVVEAGDLAAADARVVAAAQLRTDEAALTGESLPSDKGTDPVAADAPLGDRTCMLYGGTVVAAGSGRAVVTATGMRSEVGRIAGLLGRARPGPTPLQVRLAAVGNRLMLLCLAVVGLVVLLGVLRGSSFAEVALTGISLAVAAVPEGLPTVVTLALALAVRRMARRRAIVRRLPAVETLGSVDVICTDKTGTLTAGRPAVREVWLPAAGVLPADTPEPDGGGGLDRLLRAAVLASNASVAADGTATGDPTEAALVRLARERGVDPERLRREHPRRAEFAFDSARKRMSAVTAGPDGFRLSVKGAPESVLPLCHPADGRAARAREAAEALAARGHRVLAVAERSLDAPPPPGAAADGVERGLTCLGLVAMADPPRPESAAAVRACREAGIRVVMITGDHPATACAIASELGILDGGEKRGQPPFLRTGPELATLTPEGLEACVEDVAVYARVSPEDKLNIVRAWKAKGRTVAMTGDGVNDAPALREAAVGVAMGRGGTETARQASAMVLTDDRFDTIVAAVEEGRAVHGNIRRSIQYLLSGNLAEIVVMLGAAAAGWPAPLVAVHLLWINLVTDGFPALALAAEPVPADGLRGTPRPPSAGYGGGFYGGVAAVGLFSGLLTLAVYRYGLAAGGVETARTYAFSFLVFEELFRSFACRSDRRTFLELGGRSNLFHLAAVAAPLTLQMLMHHVEGFARFFRVRPVGWDECLPLLALALVPVTAVEIAKLVRRAGR